MADDKDLVGVQSLGYVNELQQLNSNGIPIQQQRIQFHQPMDNGSNLSTYSGTFHSHQQTSDEPVAQDYIGSNFTNPIELSMLEAGEVFNMDSFESPLPAVRGTASTIHETASYSDFDVSRTPWGSLSDKPSQTLDTVDDLISNVKPKDFDAPQRGGHQDNPHRTWLKNTDVESEPTFSNADPFGQIPVPATPFNGSSQLSFPITNTDPLLCLDQMHSVPASASPGIESVGQFVRRASDGPWTPFTARGDPHGDVERNIPLMNVNGVPVSESDLRSYFVSKEAHLTAFNSPSNSFGQGMRLEFQHPPREQVPRRRRRKSAASNQTVPQYKVDRSDRNAAVSKPRQVGIMPTQNKLFQSSSHSLSVPGSSMPTSPSPSNTSMASSAVDQILLCGSIGCQALFKGVWAKGNRERHWRLKHCESQDKPFPCIVEGCFKAYERTDARLKHYRKRHPELGVDPAVPRRKNDGSGEL